MAFSLQSNGSWCTFSRQHQAQGLSGFCNSCQAIQVQFCHPQADQGHFFLGGLFGQAQDLSRATAALSSNSWQAKQASSPYHSSSMPPANPAQLTSGWGSASQAFACAVKPCAATRPQCYREVGAPTQQSNCLGGEGVMRLLMCIGKCKYAHNIVSCIAGLVRLH